MLGEQHAGGKALVDVLDRRMNEAFEQPRLGPPRNDGDSVEHVSCRSGEP